MHPASSSPSPISFIQKTFMIIGAILFIALSSITMIQTASPKAAHNMRDPQPELKATAVFTR